MQYSKPERKPFKSLLTCFLWLSCGCRVLLHSSPAVHFGKAWKCTSFSTIKTKWIEEKTLCCVTLPKHNPRILLSMWEGTKQPHCQGEKITKSQASSQWSGAGLEPAALWAGFDGFGQWSNSYWEFQLERGCGAAVPPAMRSHGDGQCESHTVP